MFWIILFIISFIVNIAWFWWIFTYIKNWPELKDEFNEYMQALYEDYIDSE